MNQTLLDLTCSHCGAAALSPYQTTMAFNVLRCDYCWSKFKVINDALQEYVEPPPELPTTVIASQQINLPSTDGAGSVLGGILAVVVAAVALVIGIFVVAQLQSSLSTSGLAPSVQTSIGNVVSTTYNAFNLVVIIMIILAAVGVMAMIIEGLGSGPKKQRSGL